MCQSRIAQGAENGVASFQGVKNGSVDGVGVNRLGGVEEDAVEMVVCESDIGGVDGERGNGFGLLWHNAVLFGFLGETRQADNQR